MNVRRRPSRMTSKEKNALDRSPGAHDDLLPWADPYIASLLRDHERQSVRR